MSAVELENDDPGRQTKRWFRHHPELGKPGRIPVAPFVTEEQAALERKLLWPHVWLMVGRVEDIPETGNYFIKEIPPLKNVSLIVVRGRDGVIRTFHNVCTHRGSQICWDKDGSKGSASAFSCPYHGFTFDLAGNLRHVPDEENYYDLDKSKLGLTEVATDVWEGFIFVHLAPNPRETLKEYMGDIGAHFTGHPFQDFPRFFEFKADLNCNWKVLIAGFLEAYHTQALHVGARSRGVTPTNPHSHTGLIKLFDKHRLISLYRNPDMKPTKVGEIASLRYGRTRAQAGKVGAEMPSESIVKAINVNKSFIIHNIFPNLQLNIVNGAWYYHQFWPLSANRVAWHSRMYFPKPRTASERFFQEFCMIADRDILMEDGNNSERSQRAIESGAIDHWVLQDEEIAIQHFNKVVADYTAGKEPGGISR